MFLGKFANDARHDQARSKARALPAVEFGRRDDLVADYVKKSIGLERHQYPSHVVPSTADLLSFVIAGFGYSLLPVLQIEAELKSGQHVDINPKRSYDVKLVERSARERLA